MKRLILILPIILFLSCGLFEAESEPDYTDCKWLGFYTPELGSISYSRSGYEAPSGYMPLITTLKWIHLYREDKYSEMKRSSGGTFIVDLAGKSYNYEKL